MSHPITHLIAPGALAGAERVVLNYFEHHSPAYTPHLVCQIPAARPTNSFTEECARRNLRYLDIRITTTTVHTVMRRLLAHLEQTGSVVLHTHGYRSDILGLLAAKLKRIPIVSTVHGFTPITRRLQLYEAVNKFAFRVFDHVVCVTEPLSRQLTAAGVAAKRLSVIHNCVTTLPLPASYDRVAFREALGLAPDDVAFLSVGRLSPEKGQDVLLTAFASRLKSEPRARLVLAGDGPSRSELEQLAQRLGIAQQVRFSGHCSNIGEYYAACECFVMSSHTEGSPMVLLEAMSFGLPVVSTAVGGIPDMVEAGKEALLVPAADTDKLGVALAEILKSPSMAAAMGQRNKAKVTEHYNAEAWVRRVEGVYDNVLR